VAVKTFFDSSAFAKRYVEEPGSDTVAALCQEATDLALCVICVPEIVSAMNRRLRERRLTKSDYLSLKRYLLEDIRDATIIDLVPPVVAACIEIVERSPVRAADALHVAAAQAWKADLFVTADQRQLAAARKAGLKAHAV
jgi:predicted nucleic acid-binding protein